MRNVDKVYFELGLVERFCELANVIHPQTFQELLQPT